MANLSHSQTSSIRHLQCLSRYVPQDCDGARLILHLLLDMLATACLPRYMGLSAALRCPLLVQAAVAGLRADADAAEQSLELALDEARQGHTEASMRAEAAETARYSITALGDAGTLAEPSAGPACGF